MDTPFHLDQQTFRIHCRLHATHLALHRNPALALEQFPDKVPVQIQSYHRQILLASNILIYLWEFTVNVDMHFSDYMFDEDALKSKQYTQWGHNQV